MLELERSEIVWKRKPFRPPLFSSQMNADAAHVKSDGYSMSPDVAYMFDFIYDLLFVDIDQLSLHF